MVVAKKLGFPTSDHRIRDHAMRSEPKQCFVVQSSSYSCSHHLGITEIMLKRT